MRAQRKGTAHAKLAAEEQAACKRVDRAARRLHNKEVAHKAATTLCLLYVMCRSVLLSSTAWNFPSQPVYNVHCTFVCKEQAWLFQCQEKLHWLWYCNAASTWLSGC